MKHALSLLATLTCLSLAHAQTAEVAFPNLAFTLAVDIQHADDGTNRLFVAEQPGRVWVFENDPATTTATVFLDLRDRVLADDRFGFLGLAFHPDYAANGHFFVHYTAANPNRSVIARYGVDPADPGRADPESEVVFLEVNQPHKFHNGGQLAFGPDGMLYIGFGDGGPGRDPSGHGQNRATLLGSFLRLDVDTPGDVLPYSIPPDNPFVGNTSGFREEIWAWGFRNPWRFSFDAATGDLWAADNGEDLYEEIDRVRAGENYGWKTMEASACFAPATGCATSGMTLPVWEYGGDGQRRSVIGGYVYRGRMNPELEGRYLYGDFLLGNIWALDPDGPFGVTNQRLLTGQGGVTAFGLDEAGELYWANTFDGRLYRFTPTATATASDDGPRAFWLEAPAPNPFRATTTVRYTLARAAHVRLAVYDLLGRRVKTLRDARLPADTHTAPWDGTDDAGRALPAGVYLLRLDADGRQASRPLLRIR